MVSTIGKVIEKLGSGNEGCVLLVHLHNRKEAIKIYYQDVDKIKNLTLHLEYCINKMKKHPPPECLVKWYGSSIRTYLGIPRCILSMEYIQGNGIIYHISSLTGAPKISYTFIRTLFSNLVSVCTWAREKMKATVFDFNLGSVLVVDPNKPVFKILDMCYLFTIDPKEIDNELCKEEDAYGVYGIANLVLMILFGPEKAHTFLAYDNFKKGDSTYINKLIESEYSEYPKNFTKALELCVYERFDDPNKINNLLLP